MNKTKDRLIEALINVLQLDIISTLKNFIEGEISVLFLLYQKNNNPLPPTEIAKSLGISKGRVTALINSLSEKEYIDISLSTEDRRRFDITITEKGFSVLKEKLILANDYFDLMISKIGDEQSNQLIDIMNNVINVMKE